MSNENQHTPLGRTTSGTTFIERLKHIGRGHSHERSDADSSADSNTLVHGQRESRTSSVVMDRSSRSRSRTRDHPVISTGRGGAGNIVSKGTELAPEPEEPRGREMPNTSERITHSGRGGAGNVRSPSRDPEVRKREAHEAAAEAAIVKDHAAHDTGVHSSGRGGWGNISRSRSPAPNRVPMVSSGRGGAGNVHPEGSLPEGTEIAQEDATVITAHKEAEHGHIHSTGRGGEGNIVPGTPVVSDEEHSAQLLAQETLGHEAHSTGRGGAGNIHGDDLDRGRSEHKGLLHKIGDALKGSSKSRERAV